MSYMLSDEDSTDSDSGVRFKTESTRKPTYNNSCPSSRRDDISYESKKSYSSRHRDGKYSSRDTYKKSRSRSAERYRYKKSRSRSVENSNRYRRSRSREDRQKINKSRDYKRYDKNDSFDREQSRNYRDEIKQFSSKTRLSQQISDVRNRKTHQESSSEDEKKKSISSEENYGPVLPKSDRNDPKPLKTKSKTSSHSSKKDYGPMVPPRVPENATIENRNEISRKKELTRVSESFQPALPPSNNKQVETKSSSSSSESENIYGPVPLKQSTNNSESSNGSPNEYGPVLPVLSAKKMGKTASIVRLNSSEDETNIYGPVLPISEKSSKTSLKDASVSDREEPNVYGPVLPTKSSDSKVYGPCMPSNLSKNVTENPNCDFGPILPTNLKKQTSDSGRKVMGPALPSHLLQKSEVMSEVSEDNLGLQQEGQGSVSEDDDMIGPLPEGHFSKNISHKLLEERALEMRINALNPVDTAPRREEWMTELPDVHRGNLGLGPRQFRAKEGPDMSDRSSWTDTPEEKAKKLSKGKTKEIDIKEKSKKEYMHKSDKEQEEIVKKYKKKKKRDKSLVEMHQEKLNKKKKEESSMPKERRPFDRDVDLKVNRFDEAQKKAVLKKAQLLDTRFSSGESKFL